MENYRIERVQIIAVALEEAFEFFADPRNLERLTPDFVHFQFLKPPPDKITPGVVLEYRLRLYGIAVNWRTRIETVEAPSKFVDIQDKGPYAYWRHTHTFKDAGEGRTEVRDQVEFAMPLGPLGAIAYRLFVARSLQQIFDYRESALRRMFG